MKKKILLIDQKYQIHKMKNLQIIWRHFWEIHRKFLLRAGLFTIAIKDVYSKVGMKL